MSNSVENRTLGVSSLNAALIAALIGTIIIYAIGIATYNENGIPNADDVMRLVSMRDLIAGQNWFDPVQYRLGLDSGTLMHWSRLVDGPILAFYSLAFWFTGNVETAETFAKFAWPATTLFIALLGVNVACNRMERPHMRVPATIIAATCFMTIGIFNPGALDHHNIQVALSVWLVALLLPSVNHQVVAYTGAGIVAILMLAIGMETLPYVTLAGVWVALAFLIGAVSAKSVQAFGLAFALTSVVVMVLTVDPAAFLAEYCDAYSMFHLGMSCAGGFGLAAASRFAHSFNARLLGLAAIAILAVAVLVIAFPQCLSNPLSSLDPKLIEFWLEGVVETRSIADLWTSDPYALFGMFGMAIVGLMASIYLSITNGGSVRSFATLCTGMLFAAICVTAWQQRGSMFAVSFAILPLAFMVTDLRARYQRTESLGALLKMASLGIVSFNMFWWVLGANAAKIFSDAPTLQEQAASASPRDYCYTDDVYAILAEQPKGVVLGATDIGASILNYTEHRALAGPYHRNTEGNLVMIEALLALPSDAENILRNAGVTIIADCINSVDARDFKRAEPQGLQAALHNQNTPAYLRMIPETKDQPLVLYQVVK
ncbi:MAG: hypothetical protein AAF870_03650 [Pseudomonadota bacterium]